MEGRPWEACNAGRKGVLGLIRLEGHLSQGLGQGGSLCPPRGGVKK